MFVTLNFTSLVHRERCYSVCTNRQYSDVKSRSDFHYRDFQNVLLEKGTNACSIQKWNLANFRGRVVRIIKKFSSVWNATYFEIWCFLKFLKKKFIEMFEVYGIHFYSYEMNRPVQTPNHTDSFRYFDERYSYFLLDMQDDAQTGRYDNLN